MPAPGDRYDGDSSSTEDDESVQAYASAARNGAAPGGSMYSYSNLFRMDSLVNLQLPHDADDDHSSSSSEDQTQYGQGGWRLNGHGNGTIAERPSDIQSEMTMKRKRVPVEADAGRNSARHDDSGSNDEDEEEIIISEEHYRNMLSEHFQKYKRARMLELASARPSVAANKKRDRAKYRATDANMVDTNGIENAHKLPAGANVKQYVRKNRGKKVEQDSGPFFPGSELSRGSMMEHMPGPGVSGPGMLDLNVEAPYEMPPSSDQLGPSFEYPPLDPSEALRISGNATSIVPMMVSDPRAEVWQLRAEMRGAYEESAPGGSVLRMFEEEAQRKVVPEVIERNMLAGFQAEGANGQGSGVSDGPGGEVLDEPGIIEVLDGTQPGATMRQISSDGGLMKHCEVKVIERGDGYEIIQRKVQRENSKRDPVVIVKEDLDKVGKHWASLIRKDLPKHFKQFMAFHKKQLQDTKRFAEFCQREVKNRNIRSLRLLKAAPLRTRRLARDMVIFWKKVDKEQAEVRKKEEKDAADALKRNEELREAKRQQQRLNFLLTQTELYSHFMQNKLAGENKSPTDPADAALGAAGDAATPEEEDEDVLALKEEAFRAATDAATKQMNKTNAFDSESSKLRLVAESVDQEAVPPDAVDDIDLLNPSTMPTTSSVQQPKLFQGNLKDYQLKGLQWLVNCYEQGLNGILADEMGLGKTIQAMAFLAHLAEEKNIWGPFLVVAPASVLNNWADEVNRFCPDLKILPYWGGLNERTVLRKNINPKRLYKREAVFHVLITSYQLLVSDEKYFRRVKWQYMILDEAQAIKSANSLRWKTLLSFNCRNRLLLTGTPIQNSMAELWALLHFIMPTLFDSHEQFSEWFSKGIESHAEHGGTLNEHQLTRLHAVLKPFMLRRVKKDVITEMTNKKELMVPCVLSKRQQAFYQAIKNKISVADLFDSKGAMNEKKVLNLMNIVIQLRKVCNHPELFERNEGRSFFQFAAVGNSLLPSAFGELECIHYSGDCNPIAYKVPKLLYRDGMRCLPTTSSGSCQGFREQWIRNRLSIYSSDHVQGSIFPQARSGADKEGAFSDGGFGFTRCIDLSPDEVEFVAMASTQERWLYSALHGDAPWLRDYLAQRDSHSDGQNSSDEDADDPKTRAVKRLLMLPSRSESGLLQKRHPTGLAAEPFEALVTTSNERLLKNVGLLRSVRGYIPAVQAPPIDLVCADRGFAYQRTEELENPEIHRMLVGFGRTSDRNGPGVPLPPHYLIQEVDVQTRVEQPLLSLPYQIFGSAPPVQSFDFAKMLTDSGKLHTLDGLLKRLRAGNHRVLLFAQMTKMLNILEDYMNYRKYKYLRLDGSSTIMDRRDMVKDFQHRGDIFVFLLSTRAGGLGINLTAADTVIFYESDWNPTMDLQAMDRAHRLGQTKEVTVYRMICKGTVEEKILKRASQKNTVQQLVMTGGQSQGDVFQAEEVVSLLLDDAELEQRLKEQKGTKQSEKGGEKRRKGWAGGSGMKGVRLDAEGGGASLDEETTAVVSEKQKAPQGAPTDGVTDEGNAGAGELGSQKGGSRKRRRVEDKAPKPPKAPKLPKEPKPPKEPKAPRERKQARAPRPPRDPRLSRSRGRPKAKAEKSVSIASLTPGDPLAPGSSIPNGVDESQPMDLPVSDGEPALDLNGEAEPGASPILTSNGEHTPAAQLSPGSPEADPPLESESPTGEAPSKSEQDGDQEEIRKPAGDGGSVPGKARSRGPKRMRKISSDLEANNGSPSPGPVKTKPAHPLVGTLKLSLHKHLPAEKSVPLPVEEEPL